jgi:protein phosphatase
MGTTLVAAVVRGNHATVANVGDSRAYIVRRGAAHQVTEDHSWVADQIRRGAITEQGARSHPFRNVILRALGHEEEAEPDLFEVRMAPGDRLLLCSDGLTSMISDAEIASLVATTSPANGVAALIEAANAAGGHDNITVAIISAVGDGDLAHDASDTNPEGEAVRA